VAAAQAQQPQAQAQAPEFSMDNLLFASRAPDAQHAGERSLYFRGGRRLRLIHDAGPGVGRHTMVRYTFRRDAQTNQEFNESDYRAAMRLAGLAQRRNRLDEILAPLAENGNGRLFEIEQGGYGDPDAGYHGSRGGVAPHGIDSGERLQRLVQIAQDAQAELPPLERAWEDATAERRRARNRYDRADNEERRLQRVLRGHDDDLADARRIPAYARTDRQQADLDRARQQVRRTETRLLRAQRHLRTARNRLRIAERAENRAQRAFEPRRNYHNGLVRAEFGG